MKWFLPTLLLAHTLLAQEVPPASTGTVAQLQIALDRNGFGVGFIDDKDGARTQTALADFRAARGLSLPAARQALAAEARAALRTYTLTQQDFDQLGEAPKDFLDASRVPRMAYPSIEDLLSEKFHVSPLYLHRLNSGIAAWDSSLVGHDVVVPNVGVTAARPLASRMEIDCRHFRVRAFDTNDELIASFPCSIALDPARVPTGELRVVTFAPNPNYTFDPANFPESARARAIGQKLIIPAGPRNPVGVYWLSLSAPGFGIHGTNHPETIGRRESHGCFRLTNWDVVALASLLSAGTPVKVIAP